MKKELEEMKELLIVVDMVNGFLKEGTLADPTLMKIVPAQIELIKRVLARKGGLVFIKDTHNINSVEFKTFPPHCLKGTSEAEVIDELKPYQEYGISYEKNSTSFMFAEGFQKLLEQLKNLKRIYGIGVLQDVCMLNGLVPLKNYFNQNNQDVEIIIPSDCTATYDSPLHNKEIYEKASNLIMKQSGLRLVRTINDIDWSVK